MVKSPGVTLAWSGLLMSAALMVPAVAAAEQFVVLDLTYEATAQNTMDSHYEVPPAMGIPENWRMPVNYANGTVHIRFEVMTKPSNAATLLNLCFRNPSNYACLPYPPAYTATGVYQFSAPFSAFWQGDLVDWAMGVDTVMLILKDQNEVKVQGNSMFYPYKMRATITVVSPGSTYMPPDLGEGMGPGAGAGGGGGRGAAGAGGMSGRGGASGRGAAGMGGAAGEEPSEGAGGFDASTPISPDLPDAASDDESDFFGEDDDPIGRLPPQPVATRPNKRAPPPGDLKGSSCASIALDASDASIAGFAWLLGIAVFALAIRFKGRGRRPARVR